MLPGSAWQRRPGVNIDTILTTSERLRVIDALEALLSDTRTLITRFEQAQADHKPAEEQLADDWLALIKLHNQLAKELQNHQRAMA